MHDRSNQLGFFFVMKSKFRKKSEHGMKFIKRWNSLFIVLTLILSGCSLFKPTIEVECLPIRIGVLIADEDMESGLEQRKGYEMALEEINESGGIQGCPIELVYKDEGQVTSTESAQVSILQLADENVLAIIGGTTNDPTMRAAAIAGYFKVPFIIPIKTNDELTQSGNQWIFRMKSTNDSDAQTAFEMVRSELGPGASVVILYEQSAYGESSAVVAASTAMSQDLNVAGYYSFSTRSSDLTALAEEIVEIAPEVVYIISSAKNQTENIFSALQSQRFSTNMIIGHGPGFLERSFLFDENEKIYTKLRQVFILSNWSSDLPWVGIEDFSQNFAVFSQRNGYKETIPVSRNVETYAALHIVADALEQLEFKVSTKSKTQELTGDQLIDYREQLTTTMRNLLPEQRETLIGTINFDGTGQNSQQAIILQILNGNLVTVYPPNYAVQSPYYISGW